MGFNFKRFISHPVRAIVRVVHNPASKIIPHNIRKTKVYKKIGRPIIKIGAGVALGAVTGGISLTAGFVGLSGAGAAAGGVASALAGGLSSKPFSPVRNALLPAAAGFLAGAAARNFTAIKAATQSAKQVAASVIKKEAARALAKAKAATTLEALLKTAGNFAGSKLAQAARRKGRANTAKAYPAQQNNIDTLQAAIPTAPRQQAQQSAKKGNGIAWATMAVVAASVLSS